MFDSYIKMLSDTISDNVDLSAIRKEVEDILMFEKFHNIFHGKEYYDGICLSAPVDTQGKVLKMKTDLYNPIKIRILEVHDKTYPDPCAPGTKNAYTIIDKHPIAFGDRPLGEGERLPKFGEILRCYFAEGPDDFGKTRGIRYLYGTSNSTVDYKCANKLLKAERLKNLKFLRNLKSYVATYTPADILKKAEAYDSDSKIPYKARNDARMSKLHPQFVPYLKAFIQQCWVKLKVKIYLGDGGALYRSPTKAKQMQATWNAWLAKKPAGSTSSEEYKEWKKKKPYAGKPAVHSHHNTGTAVDFNPILPSGTWLNSKTKAKPWKDSGVVNIAKGMGMRWGGDFSGYYDPIHIDIGEKILPLHKRKEMTSKAIADGKEATDYPIETPSP
jgi:hypothetical protein